MIGSVQEPPRECGSGAEIRWFAQRWGAPHAFPADGNTSLCNRSTRARCTTLASRQHVQRYACTWCWRKAAGYPDHGLPPAGAP